MTRTPELAIPVAMMAVIGTLGLNFHVLLPLLARESFGGGPAELLGARDRHGRRRGGGRARDRRPRADRRALARRLGARVRRVLAARDGGAQPRAPGRRAGPARRGERHLRGRRQLDASAERRARDAGAGHGSLLDRLHGLDADRRADRRRDLRGVGRAGRARPGRRRRARNRRRRGPRPSGAFGSREVSSEPAAEAAASASGSGRDRDPACERASRAGAPATARHGSERRRDPRSPEPQPRAGASRAR